MIATMLDTSTSRRAVIRWESHEAAKLAHFQDEWNGLVAESRYPPFLRAEFLSHLTRVFDCPGGRLLLGRREERLVAGGIVVPNGLGRWTTYQPSQLPLGAWVVRDRDGWESIVPSLSRALPKPALAVSFTQLDPLYSDRPVCDGSLESLDYGATGWIDVAGSFEDYWSQRGKNLRQNLGKQKRRLADQGKKTDFELLERPDEVDLAFLDFARLESAGWKAGEGTAISADNAQGSFYRPMLREYAERGRAIAARLTLDGQPIALDFGVRNADMIVLLKTTYDEAFKALSPAQLLHERLLEWLFRTRPVARLEFYGKMMEWHTRWTDQTRMLFHVNAYRSGIVRSAGAVLRRLRPRGRTSR